MGAKGNYIFYIVLILVVITAFSCIDEIEPEPVDFNSVIVVEATITDETKQQTVYLNESFNFGDEGPVAVQNAAVKVSDENGKTYVFSEESSGVYISDELFAAQINIGYTLEITLSDGRKFQSFEERIQANSIIDSIYAERIINDDGRDGMAIKVDSFDPDGKARNYRYLYEETYKIIAPDWNNKKIVANEATSDSCDVKIVERELDQRLCYQTKISNSIINYDTNNLSEDRVDGFIIRFVDSDNYILSYRYSILVKQLVQTDVAYNYYQTLNTFSSNESLFSETQPGFLIGNLFGSDNNSSDILGFFEVTSIDEKRIFFNYEDYFLGEALPPYVISCEPVAPPIEDPPYFCVLLPVVRNTGVQYLEENDSPDAEEGPYFVVPRECGDCTALGSTEIPDFWID